MGIIKALWGFMNAANQQPPRKISLICFSMISLHPELRAHQKGTNISFMVKQFAVLTVFHVQCATHHGYNHSLESCRWFSLAKLI